MIEKIKSIRSLMSKNLE